MITRRTYANIFKLIIFLIIMYSAYSIIYYYISYNKLEVIRKSNKFKISSIVNISEKRLTYEAEYYLKGQFLGVSCIVDNTYYLSITKVGRLVNNGSISDKIYFSSVPFMDKDNLFTKNNIIAKTVVSTNETCGIFYNASMLPFNQINKLNVYMKDKILSKRNITNNIIEYTVSSSNIDFSFNELNRNDFGYVGFHGKSSIIFIKDMSDNLYIMSLAPIGELKDMTYKLKAPYKSLQKILQE